MELHNRGFKKCTVIDYHNFSLTEGERMRAGWGWRSNFFRETPGRQVFLGKV